MREPVAMCFSGGKDSMMALQALHNDKRHEVVDLITTVTDAYDCVSMHGTRRSLLRLQCAAVKEVIKITEMVERHFDGVCNALCHEQSNAKAERINGKIQEVKTIGRGYRRFENFRVAILFFCGGLELYPQYS